MIKQLLDGSLESTSMIHLERNGAIDYSGSELKNRSINALSLFLYAFKGNDWRRIKYLIGLFRIEAKNF